MFFAELDNNFQMMEDYFLNFCTFRNVIAAHTTQILA